MIVIAICGTALCWECQQVHISPNMAWLHTVPWQDRTWLGPCHTHTLHNTCYAKWGRGHYKPHIKKKRGMGHYIPHKQGMRRYTTQKGTMGIFYATHETNNRTLNTQQNKESLCTTNLILMKFTVTPRRFREVHHVPSCSLFRGCQFIVHTRPQSSWTSLQPDNTGHRWQLQPLPNSCPNININSASSSWGGPGFTILNHNFMC